LAASGTMTFGIGTQLNNRLGSETILTTDSNGHFTTVYEGQILTDSYIDSGANALYFPDSIQSCTSNLGFYCPPSLETGLSATNQGATQGSSTVAFSVDSADRLFSTFPGYAVFSTLAGQQGNAAGVCLPGNACGFTWGFPFFYGRKVFTAIDGQQVPAGKPPAPWWAY